MFANNVQGEGWLRQGEKFAHPSGPLGETVPAYAGEFAPSLGSALPARRDGPSRMFSIAQ
jgi:hypothetical protein